MNAARPLSVHLLPWSTARADDAAPSSHHEGWPETRPLCLRSEAFAEDLPDPSYGRALPLDSLPAPLRATARSAPLALALAAAVAALLGAMVLGLGG